MTDTNGTVESTATFKAQVNTMNSFMYVFLSYGLTALISMAVVGLIVIINGLMGGNSHPGDEQEAD